MSDTAVRTRRAVALTVLAGAVGVALVMLLPLPYRPRTHTATVWTVLLLVLCCVGELAYVRVTHGDTAEDLTFYEAVVVAGVLLLAPATALLVPLAALLVASAVMRRHPVKALFNLGSYAASTAALVILYALVAGSRGPFTVLSVLAVLLGALTFAAVNLVALSAVLAATGGQPMRTRLAQEWRLSVFMAVGNVALGSVALALAMRTPVLTPFAALPALALAYAYRAAAHGAQERERSTRLLALGAVLAHERGPEELIDAVGAVVRDAFGAAQVTVDVPARGWRVATPIVHGATTGVRLQASADGGAAVGPVQLAVLLGEDRGVAGSRPWPLPRQRVADSDRALLTSVAGTLASGLDAAVKAAALREESAKLSSVVAHASDGILVVDGCGAVTVWSPALQALTGRSPADLRDLSNAERDPLELLAAVLAGPSGPVGDGAFEAAAPLHPEHPRTELQLTIRRPDGEDRHVRASVSALFGPDGRADKVVAIVHDMTREQRVARMKSDFVATVSHELRTPITPIKGYVRLLATRGATMTDEQRVRALTVIEERADHLSRLVDDLLLASKVSDGGLGQLHVQSTAQDLCALVGQAVADVPALDGRVSLALPPTPVFATCDATRARQCLTNLLTNAAKYSPADSPVRVEVGEDAGPSRLTVTVIDQGRGIPHDQLELIFHRFHRVEDAMTMTTDGTGLGLYISRELARAMGGDVTATSELGVGSRFTLSLPTALSEVTAA